VRRELAVQLRPQRRRASAHARSRWKQAPLLGTVVRYCSRQALGTWPRCGGNAGGDPLGEGVLRLDMHFTARSAVSTSRSTGAARARRAAAAAAPARLGPREEPMEQAPLLGTVVRYCSRQALGTWPRCGGNAGGDPLGEGVLRLDMHFTARSAVSTSRSTGAARARRAAAAAAPARLGPREEPMETGAASGYGRSVL